MNKILKYTNLGLPLFFGIIVFWFFGFNYLYHLHYQEQLQMFLFTTDYFTDLVSLPGGLSDYLGTFFTQFFYFSWLGAFVLTALLIVLQQLLVRFAKKLNVNNTFLPLTFIPSIFFVALFCDENYLLSSLIAAILVVLLAYSYTLIRKVIYRLPLLLLLLPAVYWMAGGTFWVFTILCLIYEWKIKQFGKFQWTIASCFSLILIILLPITSHLFLQYPLSRLWWGVSYNRYPLASPVPLLVIWVSMLIIPFIISIIDGNKHKQIYLTVQIVLLLVGGGFLVMSVADWSKEEIMAYDYCVYKQDWKKVIWFANHKDPSSPLSVTCLNLALAEDGKLGDAMFRYYQNGPEGLLPTFQRDFTSPFISGEVYYQLGFLNTSMRFAFEAMEAIPDYKKSSRAIQRIAEVNLLNDENKVAVKYLKMLQKTLFYKDWATNALSCVGNEKLIDQNPAWARLRKYRVKDDFLFSEMEKDQMLGLLYTHCLKNKMAFEYLMAYTLLTKNLNHFMNYFTLGKNLGYKEIPAHFQEAMAFIWFSKYSTFDNCSLPIITPVKQNLTAYLRASQTCSEEEMSNRFSQTYWYYLQYRK